jgi:hypothetical protein
VASAATSGRAFNSTYALIMDAPQNVSDREVMETVYQSRPDDSWLTAGRFALVLSLLVFITFPGVVLGTQTFIFRDYGLFSYPVAYFQRQCFWRGELPLWNPYSQCGVPFLAQWNTMCLYPPALLYLLLPLTWALSFFCLAHLVWGGLGMYLLARQWTGNRLAGALAGVVFAFNGLNLNFLMWPSHVATFSWLPWLMWLAPAGWQEGGRKLAWAILAGTLQMLAGGPETILLTWAILTLLAAGDWVRRTGPRGKLVLRFGGMVVLISLMCAAQLLPFLELLRNSQRDSSYLASSHDWSMPIWGWANFLVPLFRTVPVSQGVFFQVGQYWTSSYYAGIGTALLACVAIARVRDWRVRLLAVLVFVSLVLAWGDTSVLFGALRTCFPGLGLVRYPIKFVILASALVPLLAGFGLEALRCKGNKPGILEWGAAGAMLLAVAGIIAVERDAPTEVWRTTWQNGLARAGFFVLIFCLIAAAGRVRVQKVSWRTFWFLLLLFAFWLDFRTHMPNQNPTVSPAVFSHDWVKMQRHWEPEPRLGESRAMVSPAARETLDQNWLRSLGENFLRYRLAARSDCNLLDEVPQIDCFFSLTPRHASTLSALLYPQGQHDLSNLLDFLGVSQVTAPSPPFDWRLRPTAMPLVTAGQQPVFEDEATTLAALSNNVADLRQTVFLPLEARDIVKASRESTAQARVVCFAGSRASVEITASAPSLVVCAQSDYPGWRAYVDGRPIKLWRANYAFQAVEVDAGRHKVELVYRAGTLQAGAVISIMAVLMWMVLLFHGGLTPSRLAPARLQTIE